MLRNGPSFLLSGWSLPPLLLLWSSAVVIFALWWLAIVVVYHGGTWWLWSVMIIFMSPSSAVVMVAWLCHVGRHHHCHLVMVTIICYLCLHVVVVHCCRHGLWSQLCGNSRTVVVRCQRHLSSSFGRHVAASDVVPGLLVRERSGEDRVLTWAQPLQHRACIMQNPSLWIPIVGFHWAYPVVGRCVDVGGQSSDRW